MAFASTWQARGSAGAAADGAVRAVPGKKYGLVQSKKKQPAAAQSALFEDGDSSDEEAAAEAEVERVNRQIALDRKRKQRKVQAELQLALAEDPQAFAYDEHLEGLEERREKESGKKEQQRKAERKESKFIGRLMETAQMRERERNKAMEKQIVREIEAEKAVYGDRKAYVTKNYKKHLQEQEQWEAEQAKKDAALADDVRAKGDDAMGGFYRNLLNTRLAAPPAAQASASQAPPVASTAEAKSGGEEAKSGGVETKSGGVAPPQPHDREVVPAGGGGARPAPAPEAEAEAKGTAGGTEGRRQRSDEEEEQRIREKKRCEAEEEEARRTLGAKRKREEEQQQREEKIRLARERYLQRSSKRQRKE